MRKRWRFGLYVLGTAVAALIVLPALLFVFANTEPGKRAVASLVESLSGGRVSIQGLNGRVPDRLRLAHLELKDATGVWLTADNAVLDWSPWALLWNRVEIARVEAARIVASRFPVQEDEGGVQFTIDVAGLRVPRIETSATISGRPAILSAAGSARYVSWQDWSADLTVTRQDEPGTYRTQASFTKGIVAGTANIDERPGGLIAGLLGLNDIGPMMADARASRRGKANAIAFHVQAGPMSATGNGTFDISGQTADVDFTAHAPAMQLRPGISWQLLFAEGHLHGPFARPDINADVDIRGLEAQGNMIDALTANVQGVGGAVRFTGTATSVRLARDETGLLAKAPLRLTGDLNLSTPERRFRFTLSHPLLTAQGNGQAGAPVGGHLTLAAPDLRPIGEIGGADIAGRAALDLDIAATDASYRIVASGAIEAAGESLFSRLVGPRARFNATTMVTGSDVSITAAQFAGAKTNARISGTMRNGALNINSRLALTDVSQLNAKITGAAAVEVSARGPIARVNFSAMGTADLATAGFQKQRLTFSARAAGFPRPENGDFRVDGRFDDAPVAVDGDFETAADRAVHVTLNRATWKSLLARANFTISDGTAKNGNVTLNIASLQDIAVFTGTPLGGSLQASIDLTPRNGVSQAGVTVTARNIAFRDYTAGVVNVSGAVMQPLDTPSLSLNIQATGLSAAGFKGDASAQLTGILDDLTIRLASRVSDPNGFPIEVTSTGTFNQGQNDLVLSALNGSYRDQTTVLIQPARFDFTQGIAVDRLLLDVGGGRASVSGRMSPALAIDGSVQNVSLANFAAFLPDWKPEGNFSGTANFSGSFDSPHGSIVLQGRGLRARTVSVGIVPASLDARAEFLGETAVVEAEIAAGPSMRLTVSGKVSLQPDHGLDLQVAGRTDLALFNPILSAQGRKVSGQIALDGSIAGTMSQPKIAGRAGLTGGEIQDIPYGVRVHDIAAAAESDGRVARLTRLVGTAGDGMISGNGTLTLSEGMPVNLALTSRKARPLVSDRFAASFDSDLKLTGQIDKGLTLAGTINLTQGEINLPDRFPPSIAVLDVRRAGAVNITEQRRFAPVRLELQVSSPGQLFVRGRGVDAEVRGQMRIVGTNAAPQFLGGFDLRRGTLTVVGQTLDFTRGNVRFNGASIQNKIDPALDLAATNNAGGVDVTLALTGYASAPKIQLSSSPNLPQDDILARILFQQSTAQLSPLQLAEIAQAAVSLTDAGGGFDPVSSVRRSLGLDRLAVGSATTAGTTDTQTTVTAGKYVARNIYVGATQGVGGGSQAEVQIDVSKNLKVIGNVNNGIAANSTQRDKQNDTSTSVGLRYQFEY